MKRYIKLCSYILIVCLIGTTGCQKQLDEDLKKSLTPDNYFGTEQDAINSVNAVYGLYRDGYLYGQELRFIYTYGNDEILTSINTTASTQLSEIYTMNPTNLDRVRFVWGRLFQIVKNANFTIDGVTAMNAAANKDLKGTVLGRVIGEAKFLRALAYLNLTQIWGDLPIIDKYAKSIEETSVIKKSPAAEVRKFIKDDLASASTLLGYKKDYAAADLGRATSGAATALLMKMQLWDKDWAGAIVSAEKIIADPSGYKLNAVIEQNFQTKTENSAESIFEIQFAQNTASNHLAEDYASYVPTQKLINSYEATDLRRGGYISNISYRPSLPSNRFYFSKYGYDPTENYIYYNQGINFVLLRFADVVLMYAEALNESGRSAEAVTQINKIRNRVKASSISTAISQADLRSAIMKERMLELCGETWRRFDLVRWGLLVSTVKALAAENPKGAANITDKNILYPIPVEETTINPNLLPNNGY